jgi:L-aspartate oxidase
VGECAYSGLHGANRLASNSLLEALVFAERVAVCVKNYLDIKLETSDKNSMQIKDSVLEDSIQTIELADKLRKAMWEGAGIVRSNQRLDNALEQIKSINQDAEKLHPISPGVIELKNMITVASLIVRSAMLRKESRGLHYNEDYPETDDENFLKDTILQK